VPGGERQIKERSSERLKKNVANNATPVRGALKVSRAHFSSSRPTTMQQPQYGAKTFIGVNWGGGKGKRDSFTVRKRSRKKKETSIVKLLKRDGRKMSGWKSGGGGNKKEER